MKNIMTVVVVMVLIGQFVHADPANTNAAPVAIGTPPSGPTAPVASPETWTTTDGKVYVGVAVVKIEADAVTIFDKDGGALVPLVKLSPELQKRFNYDPVKAKVAADARAKVIATSLKVIAAENAQAAANQNAEWAAEQAAKDAPKIAAAKAAQEKQAALQKMWEAEAAEHQKEITIKVDHTGESGETAPLSENGGG